MLTFSDDQVKTSIANEVGIRPHFALEAFSDLQDAVRQTVAQIKASPFIWTKNADEILVSVARFWQRTSEAGLVTFRHPGLPKSLAPRSLLGSRGDRSVKWLSEIKRQGALFMLSHRLASSEVEPLLGAPCGRVSRHPGGYDLRAALTEPRRLNDSTILHLQATAGNAAVAELLGRRARRERPRPFIQQVTDRRRQDEAEHGGDPTVQRAPTATAPAGKKIEIEFYAFIPDWLGKAFKSYSHQKGLKNQTAFDAAVAAVAGTWLPEPGSVSRPSMWYFETDERGFGGGSHRVGFHGTIDSGELGNMLPAGRTVFTHDGDPSSRVSTTDTGWFTSTNETGSVDGPYHDTAPKNHQEMVHDTALSRSTIYTKGSAAYAFMPNVSPDIDYTVWWVLERQLNGQVGVTFQILHDLFPFYEVIVNGTTLYSYSATDPGPTLVNLNSSTKKAVPTTLF